jgi:hypothetical protein
MARNQCPHCGGVDVLDLREILYSPSGDYFRCRSCSCWWLVPKDETEPATPIVLGTPNASAQKKTERADA